MEDKVLFGYLGVLANGLIILDIIQRLLAENHLRSLRYIGIILFIIAGVFWAIYGVQNRLVPTTFIALFQIVVFVFIFIIKYYNETENKQHGITVNRTKISRVDNKNKTG